MLITDAAPQPVTASFPHAGTYCPQAPAQESFSEADQRRKDPSSDSRVDKYPIPSFFEYRVNSNSYEVL